jgi:hypothetical protein
MNKLTYEEWRAIHAVRTTESVVSDLQKKHNIDANTEIEKAMRQEYDYYVNAVANQSI